MNIFYINMLPKLANLFNDPTTIFKVRAKLPYLFQIAELDSSRAGKVGMEVGSVREKIIIAFLVYKFGEENVEIIYLLQSQRLM